VVYTWWGNVLWIVEALSPGERGQEGCPGVRAPSSFCREDWDFGKRAPSLLFLLPGAAEPKVFAKGVKKTGGEEKKFVLGGGEGRHFWMTWCGCREGGVARSDWASSRQCYIKGDWARRKEERATSERRVRSPSLGYRSPAPAYGL